MKETILRIFSWVIGSCRIIVGLLVINAGYELTLTKGAFLFWDTESSVGGLFIMFIGIAFVALAIFPKSFGGSG